MIDPARLVDLPFLDAFIKETVRYSPADSLSVRRKALQAYSFKSGDLSVAKDTVVCVDSRGILHDSSTYSAPDVFMPTRWMQDGAGNRQGRMVPFTEVSTEYPLWGFGPRQCQGRYVASLMIKLAVTHLIDQYDIELCDVASRATFRWESFKLPSPKTGFRMRRR